ncbi:MAG: hypothetical protein WCO77_10465, partial [bacterium]
PSVTAEKILVYRADSGSGFSPNERGHVLKGVDLFPRLKKIHIGLGIQGEDDSGMGVSGEGDSGDQEADKPVS